MQRGVPSWDPLPPIAKFAKDNRKFLKTKQKFTTHVIAANTISFEGVVLYIPGVCF